MGTVFGPVLGAVAFILLEEGLSQVNEFQGLILGPMLLAVALYARGGIDGILMGPRRG
jgi:branched-chain amino acid transport system permease protein